MALQQRIIALRRKDARRIEAGLLQLAIHVGGYDEMRLIGSDGAQVQIGRQRVRFVADVPDVARPERPERGGVLFIQRARPQPSNWR